MEQKTKIVELKIWEVDLARQIVDRAGIVGFKNDIGFHDLQEKLAKLANNKPYSRITVSEEFSELEFKLMKEYNNDYCARLSDVIQQYNRWYYKIALNLAMWFSAPKKPLGYTKKLADDEVMQLFEIASNIQIKFQRK